MTLRIRILPSARRDLLEQEVYFAVMEGEDLRERFHLLSRAALARLAEFPGLGAERGSASPDLLGFRVWPIPEFPRLLVFYRVTEASLEVVRVLHSARDIPRILRSGTPEP